MHLCDEGNECVYAPRPYHFDFHHAIARTRALPSGIPSSRFRSCVSPSTNLIYSREQLPVHPGRISFPHSPSTQQRARTRPPHIRTHPPKQPAPTDRLRVIVEAEVEEDALQVRDGVLDGRACGYVVTKRRREKMRVPQTSTECECSHGRVKGLTMARRDNAVRELGVWPFARARRLSHSAPCLLRCPMSAQVPSADGMHSDQLVPSAAVTVWRMWPCRLESWRS